MLEAYPLSWPITQPRIPGHRRIASPFKVLLGVARDELLDELRLLGARSVVISSNLAVRRDGLPYADAREPVDPAVAVYFERRIGTENKPFVIACDTYSRVLGNMRAIGMTVGALRTIQRHGASSMLEQAFTGFAALPAAGVDKPWWEVLGVPQDATREAIVEAYRQLAAIHHPDVPGGSHERMSDINAAYAAARAARS